MADARLPELYPRVVLSVPGSLPTGQIPWPLLRGCCLRLPGCGPLGPSGGGEWPDLLPELEKQEPRLSPELVPEGLSATTQAGNTMPFLGQPFGLSPSCLSP